MRHSLYQLVQSKRGNVGLLFALVAVPLVGLAAMATEFSRLGMIRSDLQGAVDAAALAAAKAGPTIAPNAASPIMNALAASMTGAVQISEKELTWSGDVVTARARVAVPSALGAFSASGIYHVRAEAKATRGGGDQRPIEVAFAIDVTSSMHFNNNIAAAQDALEDGLEALSASSGKVSAAIVPFTDRVNIGLHRAAWLDGPAPGTWNGCVEPREEALSGSQHALSDKPPSQLEFTESHPGRFISNIGSQVYGPSGRPACSNTSILGPVDEIEDLVDLLGGGLHVTGTGRMDEGAAWAWRILSPKWRGVWGGGVASTFPRDYGSARKIAVLITDGHTEAFRHEVLEGAPPDVYGWNAGSPKGFANMKRVCDQMKANGIEVVTIFLQGNVNVAPYMQACATSPNHHFTVTTMTGLHGALRDLGEVGGGGGALRLIR
jgi:Flp pilus assembly protein TadG